MSTPPEIPSHTSDEIRRVANAVRFALACIVVGLSFPTIRLSLTIKNLSHIANAMMNGTPVPTLTQFVFSYQSEITLLSFCLPILAVVILFVPKRALAIYVLGALVLLTLFLGVMLVQAYFDFGSEIVSKLS